MISEVINALFLTYLASEYLVANSDNDDNNNINRKGKRLRIYTTLNLKSACVVAVGVLVVNVLDRVTGANDFANNLLQGFLHLPRVLFAATAYVVALYIDVRYQHRLSHRRRSSSVLRLGSFLPKVGWAFVKILPAYPLLAVLISFVFLFVINVWEALHLPNEWLNAPIYYGTLYGPFAWVYVYVKHQIVVAFGKEEEGRATATTATLPV